MSRKHLVVGGVDVGTQCVKVVMLQSDGTILGRAVVETCGNFQGRASSAIKAALDDAKLDESALAAIAATGFGAKLVAQATLTASESLCHARGAYYHYPYMMSVVDLGGLEPRLIQIDEAGRPTDTFTVRRCAIGIGRFLMDAAQYLDVHATQFQELAEAAERPAAIGSYCSLSACADLLERRREGTSREDAALGCMYSVAERIMEMEGFREPMRITGGVPEYFPGVVTALAELSELDVESVPEPIMAGAIGAGLTALELAEGADSPRGIG